MSLCSEMYSRKFEAYKKVMTYVRRAWDRIIFPRDGDVDDQQAIGLSRTIIPVTSIELTGKWSAFRERRTGGYSGHCTSEMNLFSYREKGF